MLKYYDIINKLSDSDKVHILCDIKCLTDKKYRALGIPEVRVGVLEELGGVSYPSQTALANTWDVSLVGQIADDLFKRAADQGMGLVRVPSPKIKINPYRKALSEDPMLASSLAGEYLAAAKRADVSSGLAGFGFHNDETEWLDEAPDARFIYEYIVKPYRDAALKAKSTAIFTEPDLVAEKYHSVNSVLRDMVSRGEVADGAVAVCAHVSSENTVSHLNSGGLFFEGSALALETALSKYKRLSNEIEHGSATSEELNHEVLNGKAISPEMLDMAVDRLLDFVYSVKRRPNISASMAAADLSLRAALESVVLLKNEDHILPMKSGAKVAIIGDVALGGIERSLAEDVTNLLTADGYIPIGFERGYEAYADRSVGFVDNALALAKAADVVLLFLGFTEDKAKKTHKSRTLSIPANQQELLDRLEHEKKKVIAILPSDVTADIGLPYNCAAIVMASLNTISSPRALAEVLTGKVSPSGKLASTVYFDAERRYTEYKTRRVRDGMKVGPFVGYRYYDATGELDGFPFGHGLGYTKFTYSGLTVNDTTVSFTVKNSGNMAGTEIAQVYVGKEGSLALRPKKELAGFARIELRAGEEKAVQIPLRIPQIYCMKTERFITEKGTYKVYVGSSVTDIKLTHLMEAGVDEAVPDGRSISDYIHSESNIHSDNFKLEAKFKTMKKSVFNVVAGAVALALAIILKLYCAVNGFYAGFFDFFAIVLGACGIAMFIREAVRRSRVQSEERAVVDKLNAAAFEGAEEMLVYSADHMFVNEFDVAEEAVANEVDEHIEGVDAEYLQYIDKEQSFEAAAADFELFAAERGLKLRADTAKKVFAALATSRLVVVSGMDNKSFKTFMTVLSTYFETAAYIDRVDQSYVSADSVLFRTDAQGNRIKTNANIAIETARAVRHNVHFAALTDVIGVTMPAYFSPYMNYVKNPLAHQYVTALNDRNAEVAYYMPQNLWFIINLADGEAADKLPDFVSDVATVNMFDFEECVPTQQHTQVRGFSYYQMDWLTDKTAAKYSVDEEVWKKVDKFEGYVDAHEDFHIGNKLWLCMEKYACVYMACGGDKVAAVDEAVASKLMIPVISALRGKLSTDEKSLVETVESVFGEDRAEACKRLIKACGADQA